MNRFNLLKVLFLSLFLLVLGLPVQEASANDADALLTITAKYDGWVNADVTTTLHADGTITTEVSPGFDPADKQIPDKFMPDDPDPGGTVDIGTFTSKKTLEDAVTAAIAGYLLAEWIKDLLKRLEERESDEDN